MRIKSLMDNKSHRTASLNEYSGRYSVMSDDAYIPGVDRICNGGQDTVNRQGSAPIKLDNKEIVNIRTEMELAHSEAFEDYHYWLDSCGLSKELARINLPLSTYTTYMWKIDLHNLFNFLYLRLDGHAQWEIREYAKVIWQIVQDLVPFASEAFRDFRLEAKVLSKMQKETLLSLTSDENWAELAATVKEYLGA